MSDSTQNYGNHRRFDPLYLLSAILILGAIICAGVALNKHHGWGTAAGLMAVFALAADHIRLRTYAFILQDRIIRLEMEVRLARLLTGELAERAKGLTLRQLVGLRYASDAEMPELVAKVLDENIAKADPIKRLVKNWRADHQRV